MSKLGVPREIFADAVVDYDDYRMSTARAAVVIQVSLNLLRMDGESKSCVSTDITGIRRCRI